MAKSQININTYRDKFLAEYGLTVEQIKYTHRNPDTNELEEIELFQGARLGDMKIFYPTLNGQLMRHMGNGKWELTYRIRKNVPFINKKTNKTTKYLMHGNICVFFPPEMLLAYQRKTQIEVILITEGEKKAFVACKNGFDCLGLSGIWSYKTKDSAEDMEQGELLPELKDFLVVCGVKKLVWLHDSDALDITDTTQPENKNKSETDRPENFCKSVKRFAELVFQEGLQFYYSYINPYADDSGNKLGLDDLILKFNTIEKPDDLGGAVLLDFYKSVEQIKFTTFFCTYKISHIKDVFFKDIWHLNDPKEFYNYHKQKFAKRDGFRFFGRKFKINHTDNSVEEEKNIDRELFFIKDGRYYGYDQKGTPKCFTNFTMNVLFLLKSSNNPKRIVSIKNILGQECVKEFEMDDFVNVSNFRRKLIAEGNFMFRGEMFEFQNLQSNLFTEEKIASEVNRLGWHTNGNFWAWSNGITNDGKFFPANEYGIVNYEENLYYFPAFSVLHTGDDANFENEKKFKHLYESEVRINEWVDKFLGTYGVNGTIGIAFYVASLFRDIIFPIYNEFPLLNLFGQKGSGKSTMAKSIMTMFGIPQNPMNIESEASTTKAIYRMQAQYRNAMVWVDEYKNTIPKKSVGMLKSLYNGQGYSRAQTSQDNKTTTTPVLCSTILSGQDMPTQDPALFRRVVLCFFAKNQFSPEQRKLYQELNEIESKGLTWITIELLKFRNKIKAGFEAEYTYWAKKLNAEFDKKEIIDSLWKNAAMIMAPLSILMDNGVFAEVSADLAFNRQTLYANFVTNIEQHRKLMTDNEEISVFWGTVESLVEEGTLSAQKGHFRFMEENNEQFIIIRFNPVFNAYSEKFRRIYNRDAMDKQTILNYLKNSRAFVEFIESVRFGSMNATSGFKFRYKDLGVSLTVINSPDANELLTGTSTAAPTDKQDKKDEEGNLPF